MIEKLKNINIQLLSAGIIGILIIIPLFPKMPLISVSETYVAIRAEDFLLAILLIFALPVIWKIRSQFLKDNLVLAIFGFWLIGLFSTFSSIFITQSVTPHLAILHYVRRIEYMVPFFLVYASQPNLSRLSNYFKVSIFVSFLVVLYGVGQMYFNFPVFSTTNKEFAKGIPLTLGAGARVISTFAGHYDLAAYLAIILTILGSLIFGISFKVRKEILRVLLVVVAAANFWLLLQTASRISFAAYVAGTIVVLLLLKKKLVLVLILIISFLSLLSSEEIRVRFFDTFKYGTKNLTTFQVLPVTVFASTATQSATSTPQIATKSASTSYVDVVGGEPTGAQAVGVYRSSRVRFDFEWPAAVRGFLRNPILGSGYSSLGLATDNDYLRSLGEVGVFGTTAFVLIFVAIGKRIKTFLKSAKDLTFEKTIVIGLTGTISAFLVNATFIDVFEASKIAILFWTLIGLLVATIRVSDEDVENH